MDSHRVVLHGRELRNWDAFHDTFAAVFGFPAFYGRNLNAWIDCMSSLDDPEAGMSTIHYVPGTMIEIELHGADGLKRQAPEILSALADSIAFVNQRRCDCGQPPVLRLTLIE